MLAPRRLLATLCTVALAAALPGAAPTGATLARVTSLRPEKPDLSKEQLESTATHIVVGKVEQIWTRSEEEGNWDYTRYVAELRVENREKGDGLATGQLVYVRYWTKRWDAFFSPPPPDTSGHRGLPDVGDQIRVYLAKDAYDGFGTTKDGGFTVIGANGFARP